MSVPPVSQAPERARIMEAAYRILAASGGGAISVAEVLAEADLSTRAFYRHFDSKDGLLLAMFRRDAERVLDELQTAAAAAPDALAALHGWIHGLLRLTAEPRRRQRAVVLDSDEVTRAKGHRVERARYEAGHDAALAQILHRGRSDGLFPWAKPATDAAFIRAALDHAVNGQLSQQSSVGAEEAAQDLFEFARRALGAQQD